jgi:sec-independent protein translocase protein TatB
MFDFSFSELVLIMVVALVVIGPERLPKVARTMGLLWGRAQRYINGVKADIERDMAIEEYRRLQQQVQSEASSLEQTFKDAGRQAEQQLVEIKEEIEKIPNQETPSSSGSPERGTSQSSSGLPANKSE